MISLIASISENRVIGNENKLLWHIPEDLQRFRRITAGHPVIMGRKTYQSIGRLLPKRTNIIVTRDARFTVEGAIIVHSLDEALSAAKVAEGNDEIFVIGGGQIYAQVIERADKLYLTVVKKQAQGDAYFPDYSDFSTVVFKETHHEGALEYTFLDLLRSARSA